MSLITDVEYLIQHIRVDYLHSEDLAAERIICFNNVENPSDYISNLEIPEKTVCYSPNIPNLPTEIQQKLLKLSKLKFKTSRKDLQSSNKDLTNATNNNTASASAKAASDSSTVVKTSSSVLENPSLNIVKQEIPPLVTQRSFLSLRLKSTSATKNPFQKFAFVSGKSDSSAVQLKIYIPFAKRKDNNKEALQLLVKRDATVEEVIGYSLFVFFDDKPLEVNELMTFVSCWNLRIVEDDGQIDEDFPALERTRKIQKFSFDQFAVVFNEEQAKMMRTQTQETSSNASSRISTVPGSSSKKDRNDISSTAIGVSGSTKKASGNFFIKVHLYSTLEVKQTTTVNLPGDMLLSEVLIFCCRKRKIDPNDYTLKMADTKTDVPLDRTLESLGLLEICLLKKDRGPSAGDIFLRPPEEVDSSLSDIPSAINLNDEYTSVYKKYKVTRKIPLLLTKQERYLAIDGDYIYILPGGDKLFDSSKTISFHASAVLLCQILKKGSVGFKLIVERNTGDTKTYEFEAVNQHEASEICNKISFMAQYNKK